MKNKTALILGVALLQLLITNGLAKADEAVLPQLQINFVISEPCSLVTFIDAISGRPHSTTWFADWYFKKRSAEVNGEELKEDKSMAKSYGSLLDTTSSYEFKDKSGQRQLDLNQEIISLAAECVTLPQLIDKLNGKVKEQDLLTIRKVFEYYAPIYHRLVFAPRLESLNQQLAEFEKGTTDSKMVDRLGAVKRFMQSPWSTEIPLSIVLLPLPKGGHSTHGESLGAIQVVELLPAMKFKDHADVVFHEGCHALWGVKPDLDQVKKTFVGIDGGTTAYSELNEGMATALGQGWFCKEAFGKSAKNWYTDDVIDGYAHVLMPVLVDYLRDNKQMDGEFGLKATEAFNSRFVDLDNSIKYTRSLWIAADAIDDQTKFKASLKKLLPRMSDLSIYESLAADDSSKSFKEEDSDHKAILLTAANLDKLHKFGFSNEQIDFLRARDRKPTTLKIGNTAVLVCLADTPSKQQDLLFNELAKKSWSSAYSELPN